MNVLGQQGLFQELSLSMTLEMCASKVFAALAINHLARALLAKCCFAALALNPTAPCWLEHSFGHHLHHHCLAPPDGSAIRVSLDPVNVCSLRACNH